MPYDNFTLPQAEKVTWNNYCNTQSVFLRDWTKTRTVAHNCHGKTKTSRQKQKHHGKTKNLTAKPKASDQKPNTLKYLTAKANTKAILLLLWGFWFCMRFLVLLWCFCFCSEVFGFAVTVVGYHIKTRDTSFLNIRNKKRRQFRFFYSLGWFDWKIFESRFLTKRVRRFRRKRHRVQMWETAWTEVTAVSIKTWLRPALQQIIHPTQP